MVAHGDAIFFVWHGLALELRRGVVALACLSQLEEPRYGWALQQRLSEAEATIQALLSGQIDAVVDALRAASDRLAEFANRWVREAPNHPAAHETRALALETVKHGVTVNAVCPGYTDTDMTEQGVRELMDAKKVSQITFSRAQW